MYRRPPLGLNFICKLFTVPGIQLGVPGLTLKHFLHDSMHTLELGVLAYIFSKILWRLVEFGFFGHYNPDETDAIDAAMSQQLKHHYESTGVKSYDRFDNMCLKLLGTWTAPALKAKAGPMKSILPWMLELLSVKGGAALLDGPLGCEGSALLECCVALTRIYEICKREPRRMSSDSLVELQTLGQNVVRQWQRSGGRITMKFHVLAEHLADQMAFAGNMTWSHNYADESCNFESRLRGSSCNRRAYSRMFLSKWYRNCLGDSQA